MPNIPPDTPPDPTGGHLVDQTSLTPTRKVGAGAAAGAGVVVLLAILGAAGVEVPGVDTDGLPIGEAVAVAVSFVVAWSTRERA